MTSKEDLKRAVKKLIMHNTNRAIELNQKIFEREIEDGGLSQKAIEVQSTIRNNDFGCAKSSVAELVSKILEEKITISDDDDEDDGLILSIPFYTLMVTMIDMDDNNGFSVDKGAFLLKINYCHNENWNNCPDLYSSPFFCISTNFELDYDFLDLRTNMVRFANDKEIISFVNMMRKEHLESWFGFIAGLL